MSECERVNTEILAPEDVPDVQVPLESHARTQPDVFEDDGGYFAPRRPHVSRQLSGVPMTPGIARNDFAPTPSTQRPTWGRQATFAGSSQPQRPAWGRQATFVTGGAPQRPAWGRQATFVTGGVPQRPAWGRQATFAASVAPQWPAWSRNLTFAMPAPRRSSIVSAAARPRRGTLYQDEDAFPDAVPMEEVQPQANYVNPAYVDLNPEYAEPANARPVWGFAKPLPRVVRPAMVPQGLLAPGDGPTDLERGRPPSHVPMRSRAHWEALQRQRQGTMSSARSRATSHVPIGVIHARAQSAATSAHTSAKHDDRSVRAPSVATQEQGHRPGRVRHDHIYHNQGGSILEKFPATYERHPVNKIERVDEEGEEIEEEKHDLRDILDLPPPWAKEDPFPEFTDLAENPPIFEEIHNHPTRWSAIRTRHREFLAEFLAVFVQITIGLCANVQSTVKYKEVAAITTAWSWSFGTIAAIHIGGGISGAHLNPAFTIMLWLFRGFHKRSIPTFILAQFLGSLCAAFLTYGIYYQSINEYLAHSHDVLDIVQSFVSSQRATWIGGATAFFNEFIGTALAVVTVLALGDDQNVPPGVGMAPLVIGFVGVGLSFSLSFQTGLASNPTRDLGPRLMLLAMGYSKTLFTNPYWIYGPIIGPISGALFGATVYDFMIFTGATGSSFRNLRFFTMKFHQYILNATFSLLSPIYAQIYDTSNSLTQIESTINATSIPNVLGNHYNFWTISPDNTTWDLTRSSISPTTSPKTIPMLGFREKAIIEPNRTAFVIVDMQNFFLHPKLQPNATRGREAVPPTINLVKSFRKHGMKVLWVNWGIDNFDLITMPPAFLNRFSGLWGAQTPLGLYLQESGITTLFIGGVNSDQCVWSTLIDAFFKGFDVVYVQDCTGTTSPWYAEEMVRYNADANGFLAKSTDIIDALDKQATGY
ncbi:Aquaglycerol porin AQY3 [Pseudocercospora fuligena]|uniref:Aquaglycerol porin AQY3 n=1 Tax=Pseudocercospora fuligena TaxID=685502 RepID=A0A8H6RXF2_9PEZI|nr:Aquaglycerol porin AQY3 [Pseudocercospora fuligena]